MWQSTNTWPSQTRSEISPRSRRTHAKSRSVWLYSAVSLCLESSSTSWFLSVAKSLPEAKSASKSRAWTPSTRSKFLPTPQTAKVHHLKKRIVHMTVLLQPMGMNLNKVGRSISQMRSKNKSKATKRYPCQLRRVKRRRRVLRKQTKAKTSIFFLLTSTMRMKLSPGILAEDMPESLTFRIHSEISFLRWVTRDRSKAAVQMSELLARTN